MPPWTGRRLSARRSSPHLFCILVFFALPQRLISSQLARQSLSYKCPVCGVYNLTALPPEDEKEDLPAPPPELVIKNKEQQERDEAAKKASTSSSPSTPSSQSSPSSPSAEPAASSPSASPPPSESDSSLRQRLPPVEEAPLPPHVPHEAEALAPRELDAAELAAALPQPRVQVQGGGLRQWLDVLIAFIIVAIIALLFRRIFLPNLRLDYYFQ